MRVLAGRPPAFGRSRATISAANGALLSAMEAARMRRGFLAGVVRKKLGLSLASEKTRSGRVDRIVEARSLVPFREAAAAAEQPDA
jgi:hypothetical protein